MEQEKKSHPQPEAEPDKDLGPVPEHITEIIASGEFDEAEADDSWAVSDEPDDDSPVHPALLTAMTVGHSFLEKVILALIDGNDAVHKVRKDDKRTRNLRLRQAMYAINPYYYRHNTRDIDDRMALYWMAAQWHYKELRESRKDPSPNFGPSPFAAGYKPVEFADTHSLAACAIKFFKLTGREKRSIVERLVKKFDADRDNLVNTIFYADPYPHIVEHEMLLKIAEIMHSAATAMKPPEEPTAF